MATTSVEICGASRFADLVLAVGARAHRLGLAMPAFRSPPPAGHTRTMRRHADGSVTVSIALGRPVAAVLSDVVEAVLVAADRDVDDSDQLRARLRGEAEIDAPFAPAA